MMVSGTNGSVSLQIDFHGDLDGRVILTGTPIFDPSTNSIRLEDLDYSLSTGNVFFKISDLWSHGERIAELQQTTRWDITKDVQRLRTDFTRFLESSSIDHCRFSGRAQNLHLLGIVSTPSALLCGFASDGIIQVELK